MFSAECAANVHEIGRDFRFQPRLPSRARWRLLVVAVFALLFCNSFES